MKQSSVILRESDCGKMKSYLDSDTALGSYHDFLMAEKGWCVERMQEAQKDEEAIAEKMKEIDSQSDSVSQGE